MAKNCRGKTRITLTALVILLLSAWLYYYLAPVRYLVICNATGSRYGVDPLLILAVAAAESGFNKDAVSSKGASGLMQIMPATGEWAAGCMGIEPYSDTLLFEPSVNIRIGAWYLAYLLKRFPGDQNIALAAYNAGERRISGLIPGEGSLDTASIPYAETRVYISRVNRFYSAFKKRYRFNDALYQVNLSLGRILCRFGAVGWKGK